MARRPPENGRLIQGRSPHILIQCKLTEQSETLPNLKVKKNVEHFSFEAQSKSVKQYKYAYC